MSTYLYSYTPTEPPYQADPSDPDNPWTYPPVQHAPPKNSSYVGELSTGDYVHLLPNEDAAATLIGHWDNDGSLTVVDMPAYDQLRPLGNENRVDDEGTVIATGVATGALDIIHYAGHAQRHLQATPAVDTMAEYPADEQPYIVNMERTNITDDGFPHIPYGFKLTIEFADPSRPPNARSIGVYADEACTQYLWTPGAYIWTDTGELDDEDQPVFKWMIECPVGQRTAEPTDWNVANLFGSAQEGIYSMPADANEFIKYFWENDR